LAVADAEQERLILPLVEHAPVVRQVQEEAGQRSIYTACKGHQPLLFSLATTAPAIALLNINSAEALDPILSEERVVTLPLLQALQGSNPTVYKLLARHLGGALPDMYTALLRALSKVARRCLVPASLQQQRQLSRRAAAQQRQRQMSAAAAIAEAVAASGRPPDMWSEDEAMYRTGSFMGFSGQWQPSLLGGSDVRRPLRRYAADAGTSMGTDSSCTKHKRSTIQLVPGLILFWCGKCWKCRGFAIMRDAESPRTAFEVLFTRCQDAPTRFTYDNNCNEHHYCLNREPTFFGRTRFFIDEPHYQVRSG
jgi:hypothetical protein